MSKRFWILDFVIDLDFGFCHLDFRVLGVTQNFIYLPNIQRVWASKAGSELKKIIIIGTKSQLKAKITYFDFPYSGGRGGNKVMLK